MLNNSYASALYDLRKLSLTQEGKKLALNVLSITLDPNLEEERSNSLSGTYTGSMLLAKFSPNTDWAPNEYRTSSKYADLNLKLAYILPVISVDTNVELFGGIKNITNYFQSDSDNFKNRDSDYMYGPAQPRTFYIGLRLMSI